MLRNPSFRTKQNEIKETRVESSTFLTNWKVLISRRAFSSGSSVLDLDIFKSVAIWLVQKPFPLLLFYRLCAHIWIITSQAIIKRVIEKLRHVRIISGFSTESKYIFTETMWYVRNRQRKKFFCLKTSSSVAMNDISFYLIVVDWGLSGISNGEGII